MPILVSDDHCRAELLAETLLSLGKGGMETSRWAPLSHKKHGLPVGKVPYMDPKQYQSLRSSQSPPSNPSAPNTPVASAENGMMVINVEAPISMSDEDVEHLSLQEIKSLSGGVGIGASIWASPGARHYTPMRAMQTRAPSTLLDPVAKTFIRSPSPLTNSMTQSRSPSSDSCDSSVSSTVGQLVIGNEAAADKVTCQEEQLNTTVFMDNAPVSSLSRLNDHGKACKIEVEESTEDDYIPTYEEMADRASPWYLPPHARPTRHTQTSIAKENLDTRSVVTGSTYGNARSGASTTKNLESHKYPLRSPAKFTGPNTYSNTQGEQQDQGRYSTIVQELENKIRLDSIASNASSSNVSSDSGIIVTTLSAERGTQDADCLVAPSAVETLVPSQNGNIRVNTGLSVKNESNTPTDDTSKILPHMRGLSVARSAIDQTTPAITSSTTDGSARQQATVNLSVSFDTTILTSSSQTLCVLPHMRDSGSPQPRNQHNSGMVINYTPSLSSVSTSNGGALVQETLLTAEQPVTQQHAAVIDPSIILKSNQEEIGAVEKTNPNSGGSSTQVAQGYLAPEDVFLQAVAARSMQLATTRKADTLKAPRKDGISSRYANPSVNPLLMNTTDADSFLAAAKSKENLQPGAGKQSYRQQWQDPEDVLAEYFGATNTGETFHQEKTPIISKSPALSKVLAETGAHEIQVPHTTKQSEIGVETNASCEAVIREDSDTRNLQLEQLNTRCKVLDNPEKQQNKSTLAQHDPQQITPPQGSPTVAEEILSEIKAPRKLAENVENHPLTRDSLERIAGCFPRSSTSSLKASEGNGSDDIMDESVPKEGVRATQGIPAHEQLADWEGNWMPPPCDWENDRERFDPSTSLREYVLEWCMQPPDTRIDMNSRLFASGTTLGGVDPFIAYPITDSEFISPPKDIVSIPDEEHSENNMKRLTQTAQLEIDRRKKQTRSKRKNAILAREHARLCEQEMLELVRLPKPFTPTIDIYLRPARVQDAQQIAHIYNHYVINSHITEDQEPITAEDVVNMICAAQKEKLPFIVAISGNIPHSYGSQSRFGGHQGTEFVPQEVVVGFAAAEIYNFGWSGARKGRSRSTANLQLFVSPEYVRHGIGRNLLDRLMFTLRPTYSFMDACAWWNADCDRTYENGGAGRWHQLVFQLPILKEDDPNLGWVTSFLKKQFFFNLENVHRSLGRTTAGKGIPVFTDTAFFQADSYQAEAYFD